MMKQRFIILLVSLGTCIVLKGQCPISINSFPYNESFELNDGGWQPGGSGTDWEWGTPSKPVINSAGAGTKCWIVGGLTTGPYTDGEASWLQSPCFDFTGLADPLIEFKVFWEMERQFDGAALQYSIDNGNSWQHVGSSSDASNCLNSNWYNYNAINYLSPFGAVREGWSGNIQSSSGSCKGGNGSNGWVVANHSMPYLAGKPSVIFRFIFGAGTICNDYDGFAVDEIKISESPANTAAFTYTCTNNNTVSFKNTSTPCPTQFYWDFGDPSSGTNNNATTPNATHTFNTPGEYTIKFTVSGPGTSTSNTLQKITILDIDISMLTLADCETNSKGSLIASVTGTTAPLNYSWNTSPVQNTAVATGLSEGIYTFTAGGTDVCTATGTGKVEMDPACLGIYFPSAITPNNDGRNDSFGPLGILSSLNLYSLKIFNRWGQLIFQSSNPYQRWKGNLQGSEQNGDLFVWIAEYKLTGAAVVKRKGVFLLIR
jgi:gliding motility-associated-like protein